MPNSSAEAVARSVMNFERVAVAVGGVQFGADDVAAAAKAAGNGVALLGSDRQSELPVVEESSAQDQLMMMLTKMAASMAAKMESSY